MFHTLSSYKGKVNLPRQFTFPFFYTPHPLSVIASDITKQYLLEKTDWHAEIGDGKMFGVLVVLSTSGELGFLAAFSGQIDGSYCHDFFVPPVYDLNQKDSYFRQEEAKISLMNQKHDDLVNSSAYRELKGKVGHQQTLLDKLKEDWRMRIAESKVQRDIKRTQGLTPEEESQLVKESQFLKAESKREITVQTDMLSCLSAGLIAFQQKIEEIEVLRKNASIQLQNWLFRQFRFYNAKGESSTLLDLFGGIIPPSGAGECAAPKLLNYAYLNGYQPLCMAEFWWGKSPKQIIRKHGSFYPACNAKCKPILIFMLQGLAVEPNPLLNTQVQLEDVEVLFEDDYLIVVNKPHDVLSVPGKEDSISVQQLFQEKYPLLEIKAVHRLDRATSGLLVLAKSGDVFVTLQTMFATRKVRKRYLALLDGNLSISSGVITLPLCPDIENRPCQMVSYDYGKPAYTEYQVLSMVDGRTKVWFYPRTGRTHQLRVHASHQEGLAMPILGDSLYGKSADKLYLQSQKIEFEHPVTHESLTFELPLEF